jgi:hypothetical protein
MNSPSSKAIVHPSFRPLDAERIPPARRRVGIALVALGATIFLIGGFVPLREWLFAAGSTIMVVGAFVVGPFHHRWKNTEDIRKLYGQREV